MQCRQIFIYKAKNSICITFKLFGYHFKSTYLHCLKKAQSILKENIKKPLIDIFLRNPQIDSAIL